MMVGVLMVDGQRRRGFRLCFPPHFRIRHSPFDIPKGAWPEGRGARGRGQLMVGVLMLDGWERQGAALQRFRIPHSAFERVDGGGVDG